MKPETVDYIRYRVSRAATTLQLARLAINNDFLCDAVNRLYYACFFAVSALLLTEGYSSSKHKGVQSLFGLHWLHTGKLPGSMGHFFHLLFEYRQESDYADLAAFERTEVESWYEEAHEFIDRISAEVEKQMAAISIEE